MSEVSTELQTKGPVRRHAAKGAAVVAVGVAACAACCALPLSVTAVLLGAGGGLMAAFSGWQGWAGIAGVAAMLAAWGFVGWQSFRKGRRPARMTVVLLAVATVGGVVLAALPLVSHLLSTAES